MEILWMILIGIAAGWLASVVMKGGGYGLVGDLIVGVIGAVVGGWVLGLLGFAPVSLVGRLLTATLGAMILIALLRFFRRNVK